MAKDTVGIIIKAQPSRESTTLYFRVRDTTAGVNGIVIAYGNAGGSDKVAFDIDKEAALDLATALTYFATKDND